MEFSPDYLEKEYEVKGLYLELRRAYIIVSESPSNVNTDRTTLVVRNSSRFFGKDRLPHSVLLSFHNFSNEQLMSLRPEDFDNEGLFTSLHVLPEIFHNPGLVMFNANSLYEKFIEFQVEFDGYIRVHTAKLIELLSYLKQVGRPLPYLGFVSVGEPPVHPHDVIAARELREMGGSVDFSRYISEKRRDGLLFTFLSGPEGDKA